ncbi:MAG: TrmH family RNA methyltransferase [Lapillicoccus sp.]
MLVTTRNATFQQWEALLTNRTRRRKSGEFIVQGVRPISLAIEHGWSVRAILHGHDRRLSQWAGEMVDRATAAGAQDVAMSEELLRELGEKDDQAPELVAVVGLPEDRVERALPDDLDLAIVLDRPTSPGNLGTVLRSADALGGQGVVVSGHAADPYDPRCVRASTGSLLAVPVVRADSPATVLDRVTALRVRRPELQVVATDERNAVDVWDHDLTGPTILLVGNETSGLSAAWREAADVGVRIPMVGSASSLNLAAATTAVLSEIRRQRYRRS